ncbi:putative 20S-pre-rRNA D-site endonuclease nob1 [Sclerotinia borealis F-4128]|uniref:20S-pre-rRNA D-site endonuclease NOB1 n=1 Tax=Sclerotinia borealis (strain F-4128) TaxID=1432307 RepID=W9CIL6_SCLBF|nr:putative 20S-pre-rRNA D-site endonuclease nob1 [Sclerotinia borealis F-4128]
MATNTTKSIHTLIIDAGPIIKNDPSVSTLLGQAENLYTIPLVIDEIKDAVTKTRFETTLLPFLKLRAPRSASIKVITEFARKTGDLEVLSRQDIHLMALAYELECERNHGDWRLRSVPGQKRLNGPPPASLSGEKPVDTTEIKQTNEDINTSAPENVISHPMLEDSTEIVEHPVALKEPNLETKGAWGTSIVRPTEESNVETEPLEKALESTHISTTEEPENTENPAAEEVSTEDQTQEPIESEVTPESALDSSNIEEVAASESEAEDDGEGWITPSNLKKHQQKDGNGTFEPQEEQKAIQVATITTDFAMQNVMLRMNLNLLSSSLQRIRQLKTWVLRCHACFSITRDMTKQFCARCGKPTLLRTSCSTDKDGNVKVHLKKNMQWNNRGNVYSVPKPVAGTANGKNIKGGGKGGWGNELILAEDQKEYTREMATTKRKKDKDLMDEDYLPSILTGDRGRAGGRPKVGAGKNVNSKRRN